MAVFHPRIPDEIWPEGATRPSNAPELTFRRYLEDALADAPWIVVQNLLIQDPYRIGTREIDFLVIDPTRGMITIEVKGGDYRFHPDHGWHRRVRDEIRRDERGAPKQANDSMFALVRALASHALHSPQRPPYLHGWLLALVDADIDKNSLPPDAHGRVIDAPRCRDPAQLLSDIESQFELMRLGFPDVVCGQDSCVGDLVRRHILPETRSRLGVRDEIQNARVIETDVLRPIRGVMEAVHDMDRLAIEGYPGTGKTYAALYRARRDLADGHRTLVLCYNIPLAASLTAALAAKPVRANTPIEELRARNCVVARFHAMAMIAAETRGATPDPAAPEYYEVLVDALESVAKDGAFGVFDSIIVDEGQDFSPGMMRALDALTGADGRVAFLHDPNQLLYESTPLAELTRRFGQPLKLRENLRNSHTITAFLRSLDPTRLEGFAAPPSNRTGQPVVVWEYPHEDAAAQLEAIARIVRHLHLAEDVRLDDIAILSPFRRERTVLNGVDQIAGIPLVSLEDAAKRREFDPPCLRFETLHRFKGLESPVVVLHDVSGASRNVAYEAILTACSRAQHALYVLRSSDYRGGAALPVQGGLP